MGTQLADGGGHYKDQKSELTDGLNATKGCPQTVQQRPEESCVMVHTDKIMQQIPHGNTRSHVGHSDKHTPVVS